MLQYTQQRQFYNLQEREMLKKEILNEVALKIDTMIAEMAINKLSKMINKIGK